MNVYNNSESRYAQWVSKLPVAKNIACKNAGILNHPDAAKVQTEQGNASENMDKILYSGEVIESSLKNYTHSPTTEYEVIPSSERDYTINDALNYQYNKQFSLNLEDLMNGTQKNIQLRVPGSPVPQEFIDKIKKEGIVEESFDSGRAGFYIDGLLEDNVSISHSVDYLASGYAVSKMHIEDNYSGDEKTQLLNELESKFHVAIEKVANETAEEVGGFFEENGVIGETKKIHDSILKDYHDSVDKYSEYIKGNKDYANLTGTENEWLKKDDSYMACQLRKAFETENIVTEKEVNNDYYTLKEIEKTKDMISEIKEYGSDGNRERSISSFCSEEEIGFKLGELSLKGDIFNKFSDVSDSLKDAISKSIRNFTDTLTDKLNQELMETRKWVAEPGREADFNEEHIFAVYNKIIDTYKSTGDMTKALLEGAEFGKTQHMERTKEPQYSYLSRYGKNGSKFWNNFFQNTIKYKSNAITIMPNENGYIDKQSGIELLSKNWNSFVSRWTTNDSNLIINKNTFSFYA